MIYVHNCKLVNLLLPKGYSAITIAFIVFVRSQHATQRLRNHEFVHVLQWTEVMLATLPMALLLAWSYQSLWPLLFSALAFYLLYLIDYFRNWLRTNSHDEAYYSICFEREAYEHEQDDSYATNRTPFAWVKHLV